MAAIVPGTPDRLWDGRLELKDGRGLCVVTVLTWADRSLLVSICGGGAIETHCFDITLERVGRRIHRSGRDLFGLIRESGRYGVSFDQFSLFSGQWRARVTRLGPSTPL